MESEVVIRREFLEEVLQDPNESPMMKYILGKNPYSSENYVAKLKGIVKGEEGGYEYVFPAKLQMDGKIVDAYTGSSLYVSKEYRKYLLGLMLPEELTALPQSGVTYAAGCSRDARPVYRKYLKYSYFPLFRFIYMLRSRSFVESKVKGLLAIVISFILDICLKGIHCFHFVINSFKYRGFVVKALNSETEIEEVAELIKADKHRFMELHNSEWFKWKLNIPSDNTQNTQKLFAIYENGKIVAFWMINTRYTNSIKGVYRDLVVGTIAEWGTINNQIISESDICSIAIHYFPKFVDVIQIFSNDKALVEFVPFIRKELGETNVVVKVDKQFEHLYSGYKDEKNWRLRPAMADTLFL